jgi:hypothetical protein
MSRSHSSSRGASPHKAPSSSHQSTLPSTAQSPSPSQTAITHASINSRRLLMPTVRPVFLHSTSETLSPQLLPLPTSASSKHHWPRPNPARLMRNVSGAQPHPNSLGDDYLSQFQLSSLVKPPSSSNVGTRWVGLPLRFEIVEESLEMVGYQLYAVEKW